MTHFPKPVVLIVEDEHLIRVIAAEAFLDDGFVVLEAEHADEALLLYAHDADVQVLFTDVNMPGQINGIDLAERLKAFDAKLQVIITSALPILRSIEHIPATFVAKPYDAASVCRSARQLLAA
jgi:CheY-like chemotaxis protein